MPEQHTIVITVEASGEVTPASERADIIEAAAEQERHDG